jgi:hypothetical protein
MADEKPGFMDNLKEQAKKVKFDNEGLDLLRVNLRKDPDPLKSRAILRLSSEIGVDLPGDAAENFLVMVVGSIAGTDSGN